MRLAISDNLRYLNEMRLHPSFPSTEAFLSACQSKNGMALLVSVDEEYIRRIDSLVKSLADYRAIRQPFAKDAVQPYDSACLTILTWLWMVVNDFRVTTVYPFVERLLPELMHMQDIQDNQELQKWAQVVLAAMAALPYPASMVPSVLDSLLDLFKSPSWRTRLAVLPLLQVFFFHQLYALSEEQITKVLDTLYGLLKDNHVSCPIFRAGLLRLTELFHNRSKSVKRQRPP
jgi:proteasome activator subunit 4